MDGVADIGLIGLGVMGRNLALNLSDHDFTVAVYNRTVSRVDEFLSGEAAGKPVIGTHSLPELVASLQQPRKVLMMIPAGDAVDAQIEALLALLEPGDIIIDGGNSLYSDTMRRANAVEDAGLLYVGAGISGGEEGARHGPSIMPGGSSAAWPHTKTILQSIAAVVDGVPCSDWVGPDGSGHFVKMVHNGIEYGDMQVIAEAYHLMSQGLNMTPADMQPVFSQWNEGKLESYLIEITAAIMRQVDDDGTPLLDRILDTAAQKGTGKWTVIASMDMGVPTSLIGEAVYARMLSAMKEQRQSAARQLSGPTRTIDDEPEAVLADLHDALYASKITSYAQGFMLLSTADREYGWKLDLASIASMWRGGSIVRSRFLGDIMSSYREQPDLPNLLLSPNFTNEVERAQEGWRRTVQRAAAAGIPVPAYAAALSFYDGYRSARLPANLIQAQRDFFGAHTYERVDRPRGEFFHTEWGHDT